MASRVRRVGVALLVTVAVFTPLVVAPGIGAATTNRVGVVVNHDELPDETRCVKIRADSILAIDLLNKKTDLALYTEFFEGGLGRAVCWLDGEGGTLGSCFNDPEFRSWNLYLRKQGRKVPKLTPVGISQLQVPAGAVFHLLYDAYEEVPPGSGNFQPPPPPARVSLRSICGG